MLAHGIIQRQRCIQRLTMQSLLELFSDAAKRVLSPAGSRFTIFTVDVLNLDSLDETPDDVADLSSSHVRLRCNRSQVFLHVSMVKL